MSGTASVPNSFAAAVTATGAQLDANYATVVAYINDPTNRNNYAADAGTTNTVLLTFSPAVVGGYTAGLEITFKSSITNSGAMVVNANGLGNVSLVNPDGSALGSAQVTAGSTYKAVYDGTRFVGIGFNPVSAATQAQMETATATGVFVSPGAVVYSPFSAKASGCFNGTATGTITQGALANLVNVARVVRSGTGTWAVVLSNPMSLTLYPVVAFAASAGGYVDELGSGRTTAGFTIQGFTSGGTPSDLSFVSFVVYGDLP